MKNKLFHKGEQRLRYSLKKLKNKGAFDIINYISENFTLFRLMDKLGNMNHAISIVGYCIFDYNYKQALCFTRESLDLI